MYIIWTNPQVDLFSMFKIHMEPQDQKLICIGLKASATKSERLLSRLKRTNMSGNLD